MEERSSSLTGSPYTPVPPAPVPRTLKRPALDAITNQPSKRAVRRSAPVPLASVFEVSASFRPAYQTRTTRTRIRDVEGENAPVVEPRWSGRFLKWAFIHSELLSFLYTCPLGHLWSQQGHPHRSCRHPCMLLSVLWGYALVLGTGRYGKMEELICIVIIICMLLPAQKCHSAAWSDIYRFEQVQIVRWRQVRRLRPACGYWA
jgi:hypothetical protein